MSPMTDWRADPFHLRHHVLIMALSDRVMFPGARAFVELPRSTFLEVRKLLQESRAGGIGLVATKPGRGELYQIGTFCRIVSTQAVRQHTAQGKGPSMRVVLEGCFRFRVLQVLQVSRFHVTTVQLLEEPDPETDGVTVQSLALHVQKSVLDLLIGGSQRQPQWPTSASRLADTAAAALLSLSLEKRQQVLETVDVKDRLEGVLALLQREVERQRASGRTTPRIVWPVLGRQQQSQSKQDGSAAKGVGGPLGGGDGSREEANEVEELSRRISSAGLPVAAMRIAQGELKRLKSMQPEHPEYAVAQRYVETLASLPWRACTEDKHDLQAARASLDADHFGLRSVKRRLLEFLAVQKLRGRAAGPILCLHGPPGIGKTSLGQSIARALGRRFHRVALGGLRDEAELRGHRRTYIGSAPGVIIQALQTLGVNNPVILLDEVDKLAHSSEFNPEAALLELLDPEQNSTFRDHYLGTPFDLSRVIFLCTANDASLLSRPLLDRMELLDLPAYTLEEKLSIAARHLLPKQRRLHALQREAPAAAPEPDLAPLEAVFALEDGAAAEAAAAGRWAEGADGALLALSPEALRSLIAGWTAESGVRSLERLLAQICRWAALRLQGLDSRLQRDSEVELALASCGPGSDGRIHVGAQHLPYIIGQQHFEGDEEAQQPAVGVAMGLASSAFGARPFSVEAVCMPSDAEGLVVTGRPGPVVKESVEVAMSLAKACLDSNAGRAPLEALAGMAVHVHFAVKGLSLDGPAAGLAVLLALASLLAEQPLRGDTAATGEITLRGEVLAVGGIRDKVLAAHRAGIRHVLLPLANRRQVEEEVPAHILAEVGVRYVQHARDALDWVLEPAGADAGTGGDTLRHMHSEGMPPCDGGSPAVSFKAVPRACASRL